MDNAERREDLQKKIEKLQAELQERKLSLPAHSIRPHQLMIIEELEEEIRQLEEKAMLLGVQGGKEEK